jgi:hypothetical protein
MVAQLNKVEIEKRAVSDETFRKELLWQIACFNHNIERLIEKFDDLTRYKSTGGPK